MPTVEWIDALTVPLASGVQARILRPQEPLARAAFVGSWQNSPNKLALKSVGGRVPGQRLFGAPVLVPGNCSAVDGPAGKARIGTISGMAWDKRGSIIGAGLIEQPHRDDLAVRRETTTMLDLRTEALNDDSPCLTSTVLPNQGDGQP